MDSFFAEPAEWLARMESVRKLPEYVVAFDPGAALAAEWLDARGYQLHARFFNSHAAEDRGLNREVLVYRLH